MNKLIRLLLRATWILAVITVTIVVIRAFDARSMPELSAWHEVRFENEFNAANNMDINSLSAYLALEELLFEELHEKVVGNVSSGSAAGANRFNADSMFSSGNHEIDWNRTTELRPDHPRGTVLMLHGLTDSPYSMRSTAELFFDQGYHVLVPRLPGHGTAPVGILEARWEDWRAVVEIGASHLRSKADENLPFVIVGYSNGGALAVNYALDAIENNKLASPDRVILMSPAIGITPFAFFASWNRTLSWIPFFEKFAWESVLPEYDPYKYNSFPKSAGNETHELAQRVQKRVRQLDTSDAERLPPIIVFAPLVDSTVRTEATADRLLAGLNRSEDELVLYDINRLEAMAQFFRADFKNLLERLENDESRKYRLTVLTNQSKNTLSIVATSRQDARVVSEPIESEWPPGIYAMSHVAVPIPADDRWYGDGRDTSYEHVSLGNLNAYGEKNLLSISPAQIMRLRYNPFYDYQERRLTELLDDH